MSANLKTCIKVALEAHKHWENSRDAFPEGSMRVRDAEANLSWAMWELAQELAREQKNADMRNAI